MNIGKKIHFLLFTFFLASLLTPLAFANDNHNANASGELKEGSYLPIISIEDQFGNTWQIQEETKKVIFASNKNASGIIQEVLGQQNKDFLTAQNFLYLADLSRMPSFITKSFALPSLRKSNFKVGIVLDQQILKKWPTNDASVIVFNLKNKQIQTIEIASNAEQLKRILGI